MAKVLLPMAFTAVSEGEELVDVGSFTLFLLNTDCLELPTSQAITNSTINRKFTWRIIIFFSSIK